VVSLSLIAMLALLGGGFVAYFGGWRCRFDLDRAGAFDRPVAGAAALVWLLVWGALVFASSADHGLAAFGKVVIVVPIALLYAPFLAFHAAESLRRAFSTESALPPDPEDPFERAKAAEDRGDTRAAVERYEWLLEREPAHFDARTRLADLLARTGRLERAREVLDKGIALDDAEGWMRFKWRELRTRIEERVLGEEKSEDGLPTFRALGDVRAARLEAWEERPRSGDEDGPLDASSLEDGPR
jgi:tetratricopeptide (TPR) repeat protein